MVPRVEEVLIGRSEAVFAGLAQVGLMALALSIAGTVLVHTCGLLLRSHRTGAGAGFTGVPRRTPRLCLDRSPGPRLVAGWTRAREFRFRGADDDAEPASPLYLAGSLGIGFAVAARRWQVPPRVSGPAGSR